MTERVTGYFYVDQLPDGRFVAAAASAPFFCFRARSEEEVLSKVSKALAFYKKVKGKEGGVKVKPVTRTVTTLQPTKRVPFERALEAA